MLNEIEELYAKARQFEEDNNIVLTNMKIFRTEVETQLLGLEDMRGVVQDAASKGDLGILSNAVDDKDRLTRLLKTLDDHQSGLSEHIILRGQALRNRGRNAVRQFAFATIEANDVPTAQILLQRFAGQLKLTQTESLRSMVEQAQQAA